MNYIALKHASINEWLLVKAMVNNGCLNEELETVIDTFNTVDIGNKDGKVTFEELFKIAEESGLIKSEKGPTPKPSKTPAEGATPSGN